MKIIIVNVLLTILLITMVFALSGCTLKIETTDNSISASVDGDTTEKVDGILDWIKNRISRIFVKNQTTDVNNKPLIDGESANI